MNYDGFMSMALNKTIERLKTYTNSSDPILSIYFHLPVPKRYTNTTIVNKLQSCINANMSFKQREAMKNNIRYIVGFMQDYQQARGEETLAFFSGGDNLFEVLHLPYKIPNTVKCAHEPYLEPLYQAQEDTRRYLVILSDKQKAILYTIFAGSLEAQEEVFDDSVPHDAQGRWANAPRAQRNDKLQRHIHEHLQKHFAYIASRAVSFIKNKPIAGVILGGHKTEMSQFKEHLPKNLKEKVVGNFVSELNTNFNEILGKSKEVVASANHQYNHPVATA
jgi:peptide subunit release factor 1 (eRF1)